jgi:hypothetical protein
MLALQIARGRNDAAAVEAATLALRTHLDDPRLDPAGRQATERCVAAAGASACLAIP